MKLMVMVIHVVIDNGITELLNRLELMAAADDNNLINIYRIHEAGLEVFKDHPLMKDDQGYTK